MASISELKWETIEYIITTFDINIKDKTTKLQLGQVQAMYIEKDFDELSLPIFMVSLAIPEDLYYNIQKNHNDTTFNIVISTQKRNDIGEAPTNKSIYLKDVFIPLGVDGTPFTNKDTYKKAKEETTDGDVLSMTDLQTTHTFVLGKKSTNINMKKIQNKVLSGANLLDAISYLLTSCGFNNVLMSKLDNNTSYSELILLPIPMIEQLRYLNSMYGFYKQGAQIFLDFDTNYILRNCAKCTAYRDNEIKDVNFVVYKPSGGHTADKGSCVNGNEGYINCGAESNRFNIDDKSKSSNVYLGNNSLIINDEANVSEAITNSNGSYNVITTTTHNNYIQDETRLRLKELSGVVTLTTMNIDLRLLTPNKNFKILSDDSSVATQVNAPFRLSKYIAIFGMEGNTLSPVVTIELKKTES